MYDKERQIIRAVGGLGKYLNHAESNSFISRTKHVESELALLTKRPIHKVKTTRSADASISPLAVKDNIVTTELHTTCGSQILQHHRSPFGASILTGLLNREYEIVGKTNLDEFGMGSHSTNSYFGPVRHPSNLKYSAGGSSGGSAVAVASGQLGSRTAVALGTDTGGSVRLPAAYTGVVGFKPSYGVISRWGVIPYANSLDTVGVIGNQVSDANQIFKRVWSYDPRDPSSISEATRQRIGVWDYQPPTDIVMENITIGIPLEYNIAELEPGVKQAWTRSLDRLQAAGCNLVPVSLPNTKHALSAYYVIAASEAASNLSKYDGVRYGTRGSSTDGVGETLYSDTRGTGFGDEVKRRILLGSYSLSADAIDNYFIKAQKVRRLVQRDFDRVFRKVNPMLPEQQHDLSDMDTSVEMQDKRGPHQVDYIICPTAPTVSPTLSSVFNQTPVDTYMNDVFTVPSSLAGIPAISIPVSVFDEYLKPDEPAFAGIQIIGQYGDDCGLLDFSKIVQMTCQGPTISYQKLNSFEALKAIPNKPSFRGIDPELKQRIPEKGNAHRTASARKDLNRSLTASLGR